MLMDDVCIGSDKGKLQASPWKHDGMDLDATLIGSDKGALQKTPWKHDERAHAWYFQLMDTLLISSDKGSL